ncbi:MULTISPECIES: hypothetical protein [unclassified Mesorhizobium]|uniref:hypothetical protein n=1 Tax=unclassified Mesorhizobium TaxID=325217 RepID=UPI00112B7158|nr:MULTISPECIES: hypothetical protein [unclassified Mesorhizobium]MBZ9743397.1 hypothetical protein [Mesorhizobium sp. CO1-1-4]MBZ9805412.1 hypothetical protein [Mesorhizobium sp. ES1-6]MBZ9994359.1 hypothetical protein [Mesorhizobium sp. BH1-1-4]TPL95799.1 hypothetical protein FJ948_05200 [Mesorhizobium sp. B2-3-12]
MRYDYSSRMLDDVYSAVQRAFKTAGIVNISAVAEQVRVRNLAENVALEDVEYLVLQAAQRLGAAIEFDTFGLVSSGNRLADNGEDSPIVPLNLHRSASMQ